MFSQWLNSVNCCWDDRSKWFWRTEITLFSPHHPTHFNQQTACCCGTQTHLYWSNDTASLTPSLPPYLHTSPLDTSVNRRCRLEPCVPAGRLDEADNSRLDVLPRECINIHDQNTPAPLRTIICVMIGGNGGRRTTIDPPRSISLSLFETYDAVDDFAVKKY